MANSKKQKGVKNNNTRKFKSVTNSLVGGEFQKPHITTIIINVDENGIHNLMLDDIYTDDALKAYYDRYDFKPENHLFNKSLLFDIFNTGFEKKIDAVRNAISNFVVTDKKYEENKQNNQSKNSENISDYIVDVKEKSEEKSSIVKYLIRNTDIDVVNFIKVMHKFKKFLTTHGPTLLEFPTFKKEYDNLINIGKEFNTIAKFNQNEDDLKSGLDACLSVIKTIVKDPNAFNSFATATKIEYIEDKKEIDETKESEWSKAEYDILEKYSDKSNTIYFSLGKMMDVEFCDECTFFQDEVGFFDELMINVKNKFNKKIKKEIMDSAQKAVNENDKIKQLIKN
jgi:hypothetical protein